MLVRRVPLVVDSLVNSPSLLVARQISYFAAPSTAVQVILILPVDATLLRVIVGAASGGM